MGALAKKDKLFTFTLILNYSGFKWHTLEINCFPSKEIICWPLILHENANISKWCHFAKYLARGALSTLSYPQSSSLLANIFFHQNAIFTYQHYNFFLQIGKFIFLIFQSQTQYFCQKKNGWALGNLQLSKNLSSSLLAETLLENLFYFHQVRNWAPPFSRMLSINIFRFKLALQSIDIGARLGWTKILTKMASVTMHLWILKCENLNEFF